MGTRTGIAVAAAGLVFYLDAPRAEAPLQALLSAHNRYLAWYYGLQPVPRGQTEPVLPAKIPAAAGPFAGAGFP